MCAFEDYTPYDSQALLNLLFTLSCADCMGFDRLWQQKL